MLSIRVSKRFPSNPDILNMQQGELYFKRVKLHKEVFEAIWHNRSCGLDQEQVWRVWWGNARCISGTTWGHLHQVGHIARIFCVYLRQVKHNQLSVGWKWFLYKNIEIQFQDHSCLMSLCICQGINLIGDQFTALRNHSLQWDKSQMFRQHELIETFWSDTHVWCPMSYTQYPTIHGNFMEWGPVDSIFCECNWELRRPEKAGCEPLSAVLHHFEAIHSLRKRSLGLPIAIARRLQCKVWHWRWTWYSYVVAVTVTLWLTGSTLSNDAISLAEK